MRKGGIILHDLLATGGIQMEKEKVKSEVIEWIKSILLAIVIAFFIKTFIFNTTYVLGNSMNPTLYEKDRLFTNKVSIRLSDVKRKDIIVLEAPDAPGRDYIKRIIGVEGDIVEIKDGKVYLNGEVLEEDYLGNDVYTHIYGESYWEVPEDHVFVLGDNRQEGASKDSRFFGCVSIESIKGIANFRYFPFNDKFGKLE